MERINSKVKQATGSTYGHPRDCGKSETNSKLRRSEEPETPRKGKPWKTKKEFSVGDETVARPSETFASLPDGTKSKLNYSYAVSATGEPACDREIRFSYLSDKTLTPLFGRFSVKVAAVSHNKRSGRAEYVGTVSGYEPGSRLQSLSEREKTAAAKVVGKTVFFRT